MNGYSRRTIEVVALLEGISFLVLLGVAMPLKYVAGIAVATTIVGLLHGLAFLAYAVVMVDAYATKRWPTRSVGLGLLAAIVPAGTFVFLRHLRRLPEFANAAR